MVEMFVAGFCIMLLMREMHSPIFHAANILFVADYREI